MDTLQTRLIAHWPLTHDARDHSATALPTEAQGVTFADDDQGIATATFDGRTARLTVADHPALHLGTSDLTAAAWVHTDALDDIVGSVMSKFDFAARRGFNFDILTNSGMTSTSQSNYRHVHFGIDAGRCDAQFTDCGRPGNAVFIGALASIDGNLYAGTIETGDHALGQVWRYDGGHKWVSLGNPSGCTGVFSLAWFNGALHTSTSRYVVRGSLLDPSSNKKPGGHVFRLRDDLTWQDIGQPGHEDATPDDQPDKFSVYHTNKADDTVGLTVFRGELYCMTMHRTGVFKYAGGQKWLNLGPHDMRTMCIAVYRDRLYALMNGGPVYRYEGGDKWTDCGCPKGSTQTYSSLIHRGVMYVGTWPNPEVFRFEGEHNWPRHGGWIGTEREIMAMALYNGKGYIGSLPTGNVWRMDGEHYEFLGTPDNTPGRLRRVWSMAVHEGKLFCGTLPGGRVYSLEAGKSVTSDRTLPAGWRHLAAVKDGRHLWLYIDGKPVAVSPSYHAADYDLSNNEPMHIGFGAHEYFKGKLRDVRLYSRALEAAEVARLAAH
jgi:hypothetical protein